MSLARRLLQRTGSTALGPPLVRLVGGLARGRMLGFGSACRAIEALMAGTPRVTTIIATDLDGHRCELELDLSIPSCRSVFVQPFHRADDWPSIRLFCQLARDATTIIDVGANLGVFTYFAVAHAPRARIIAYEPAPRMATLLEINLARNGWSRRVEVRRAGVSATSRSMTFYVRENDHESSFEDASAVLADVRARVEVPVVALDDVFERESIVPATTLLKIDVEGHEMRVLDGLERTLARSGARPTVLMEFLGKAINEDRVIDRVLGLGLHVSYVTPRGLVRVASTSDLLRVHELGQSNFLLTDRAVV